MGFRTEIPVAARQAFLTGGHSQNDTYFIALYEKQAPRDKYSANGESGGQGYTPGGQLLDGHASGIKDGRAWLNWSKSPSWPRASVSASEALIYNQSRGGTAVAILKLDQTYKSVNGEFALEFPANGLTALVVL